MAEPHTNLEVTIEKLVYGGDGLARLDGRVVLIPYTAPNETVRAEVEQVKSNLFRGRLIEVVSASGARIEPNCPYYQRCGGCQYQHLDSTFQVEQKRAILHEVLRRVGKIDFDGEIAAISGEPWQYRNRVQVHLDRGQVGYFEHGSRRLCAVDRCPVASPMLNEAIGKLNGLAAQTRAFTGGLELFTNETDVQINLLDRAPRSVFSALESIGRSGPIEYGGFRVSRNSFFQVNRFLIDPLVDCAVSDRRGHSAVDLYAGVGLFSARLVENFAEVSAVESGQSAFSDLVHNMGARVTAHHTTVEEYLSRLETTPDLVLADPPRAGLGKHVVQELIRLQSPRVTVVACDPATLARDLQGLLTGGYRVGRITLVDLFPQTFHIETVVDLEH